MQQKIKVYATGQGREPKLEGQTGLDGSRVQFVGWSYDPTIGHVDANGQTVGGWVLKTESEELTYCAEYRRAVQAGTLVPADEQSARLCGAPYVKRKQ